MLFKNAFQPRAYQKVIAIGYYTPMNGFTTIQYKIGKQGVSSVKIPTFVFEKLTLDDNDKSLELNKFPELVIVRDPETNFKKLEYHPIDKDNSDVGED